MKKFLSILLCLILLAVLPCSVSASHYSKGSVIDNAGLLTDWEESRLADLASNIYDQTDLWVAIVTTESLGAKSAQAYADDFYDRYYYDTYPNGVLLLIAMDTREWAISTCGTGIRYLSDSELDHLFLSMSYDLGNNRFYDAFTVYLNTLPTYLSGAGKSQSGFGDYMRIILVSLLTGAAAGGITILILRGQMNTAKYQTNAGNYLVNGSFQLKKHLDIFLYSRVTRTRKADSHGGSSHRSSGGVRHGGRSGRF